MQLVYYIITNTFYEYYIITVHIQSFDTLCNFNLFLLLFIGFTVLFKIIHGSHYTIQFFFNLFFLWKKFSGSTIIYIKIKN